jgi:23S rRNA pseudouridine2605 synthase
LQNIFKKMLIMNKNRNKGRPNFQDNKKRKNTPGRKKFQHISGERKISKKEENSLFPEQDSTVRLNRYLANSGICSRREADKYIQTGVVEVNGKIVTELGIKVKEGDVVKFGGEQVNPEKKVYLLLNKPKDYITTVDDPHAEKTVLDIVGQACKERIYPVGRLDRSTTGVLLLTNDGDLTKKLLHPKFNKKKVYYITLDKNISKTDMIKLTEGIDLEDGPATVDAVSFVAENNAREIGVEIHSGRNRIIRRMFEAMGYKVVKLDRVYFCGLTKKGLRRGAFRFLSQKEINMLKMGAFQ